MADVFTKATRSQVMATIRSEGNKDTEGRLAGILRSNGIKGWRRHLPINGKPDFAFPKHRIAVFVDGCFWHGCSKHLRMPKSNRGYWRTKIGRNRIRDRQITRELRRVGWLVMRIWEHALRYESRVVKRFMSALGKQGLQFRLTPPLEAQINYAKRID